MGMSGGPPLFFSNSAILSVRLISVGSRALVSFTFDSNMEALLNTEPGLAGELLAKANLDRELLAGLFLFSGVPEFLLLCEAGLFAVLLLVVNSRLSVKLLYVFCGVLLFSLLSTSRLLGDCCLVGLSTTDFTHFDCLALSLCRSLVDVFVVGFL